MKSIIIYSVCLIICLSSCEKRSGDIVIEEREVAGFKAIEVNDIFNIFIQQDTVHSLLLEGGENLLPNIITRVENGTLKIDNENTQRWSRDYDRVNVRLTVDTLNLMDLQEPSYIVTLDTLCGDYISIFAIAGMNEADMILNYRYIEVGSSHTAGGKLNLSGKVSFLRVGFYNSMQLDAQYLYASDIEVMSKSIGDIYINCSGTLKANIFNDGNVYYRGNPQSIIEDARGKGRLISLD